MVHADRVHRRVESASHVQPRDAQGPGRRTLTEAEPVDAAQVGRAHAGPALAASPGRVAPNRADDAGRPDMISLLAGRSATPGQVAARGFTGTGRALPDRAYYEQSFGASFADVRVFTDASAQAAARRLDARAYAVGTNIAFARPELASDRALVAHELTHVLQDRGGVHCKAGDGAIETEGEPEAEAVEAAVAGGHDARSAMSSATTAGATSVGVTRGNAGPARSTAPAPSTAGARSAEAPAAPQTTFTFQGFRTAFSRTGREAGYEYKLFDVRPTMPVPALPFAGLGAQITASVIGNVGIDFAQQRVATSLGVEGFLRGGLLSRIPEILDFDATIQAAARGRLEYRHDLTRSDWSLAGRIAFDSAFHLGVSFGDAIEGIIGEWGIEHEVPLVEIGHLEAEWTRAGGARRRWRWSASFERFFEALGRLVRTAQQVGRGAQRAGRAAARVPRRIAATPADVATMVTNWLISRSPTLRGYVNRDGSELAQRDR